MSHLDSTYLAINRRPQSKIFLVHFFNNNEWFLIELCKYLRYLQYSTMINKTEINIVTLLYFHKTSQ